MWFHRTPEPLTRLEMLIQSPWYLVRLDRSILGRNILNNARLPPEKSKKKTKYPSSKTYPQNRWWNWYAIETRHVHKRVGDMDHISPSWFFFWIFSRLREIRKKETFINIINMNWYMRLRVTPDAYKVQTELDCLSRTIRGTHQTTLLSFNVIECQLRWAYMNE